MGKPKWANSWKLNKYLLQTILDLPCDYITINPL